MDIEIGSLSKAFSVMGGFIAAKQPLIDHCAQFGLDRTASGLSTRFAAATY